MEGFKSNKNTPENTRGNQGEAIEGMPSALTPKQEAALRDTLGTINAPNVPKKNLNESQVKE
jgi:hypothetical protein